ncbi:Guanine nucleotide-binding protein subunit alpha [Venturia nashicola]|uniref:Iron-sulfur cluster assembly factor IBA57 homolog, mitochondrial n=1 Tax=Venturia nashicola TaxID=86259 RepID=A0A4Z1NRU8_9PEZI|nr:Guanine nucleotide-binding protein subunit alpha [Venturia nashicola]
MSLPLKRARRTPYVCANCLKTRRHQFTTGRILRSTAPPKLLSSGYARLTNRTVISLTGSDASKFLQGLTTNNVDPSRDTGWFSAFLNAQGRVLMDSMIYPIKDTSGGERGYLIEVDKSISEDLLKHLRRHKLRSKIELRDAGEEWAVWASWTQSASTATPSTTDTSITLLDPRLPSLGTRILLSNSTSTTTTPSSLEPTADLAEAPLESYTLHRYTNGVPEGPLEILPQTALPLESNFDYLAGIDFRKGCYVGQELTIRTQHTGVVRKRILPVELYNPSLSSFSKIQDSKPTYNPDVDLVKQVASGTDIKAEGGKRPSGKFLAGMGNVGLALCRLENMTSLRVSAEGGTYKDDLEFRCSDTGVKVKAFIPGWLRLAEERKREGRKIVAAGED